MAAYFCQWAETMGLPQSFALIYHALYLSERPLSVAEIIETSGLSKGSVSGGLRLLERMRSVKQVFVPNDRRTFYQPELSVRALIAGLLQESFIPSLERGEQILNEAPAEEQLSDHVALRLASLRSWNQSAKNLAPALGLLE